MLEPSLDTSGCGCWETGVSVGSVICASSVCDDLSIYLMEIMRTSELIHNYEYFFLTHHYHLYILTLYHDNILAHVHRFIL